MKIRYLSIILLFCASLCYAGSDNVLPKEGTAFLTETITAGTTARSIHTTASTAPELKYIYISVTGSNTVFLMDGTTVATNTGHLIVANDSRLIGGINNCKNFSYISLGTSTITLTYFR